VFLIASARDDLDPIAVLFESAGLRGDLAQGRAPWEIPASGVAAGANGSGNYAEGLNPAYGKVTLSFGGGNTCGPLERSACLTARGHKCDFEVETFVAQSVHGHISHTLSTANSGKGCSEDGTGRGVPIVGAAYADSTPFAWTQNSRGATGEMRGDLSPTLRASSGGGDKDHVLTPSTAAHFRYSPAPLHENGQPDWSTWRVRRLMPVECEHLQGIPDTWTLVPYRGKPASDAPRYKAIGNSMAAPCITWIDQRLQHVLHLPEQE